MRQEKLTVLCWGKASDAFLIQKLQDEYKDLHVIIYQIPPQFWVTWIWHRIRLMGLFTLVGHLALSMWIRAERILEKISGNNIWIACGVQPPSWKDVRVKAIRVRSEKNLQLAVADADVLLLTDNIRLSYSLYRKSKAQVFQIIWGTAPHYLGDSGGFWAYATRDDDQLGVALIERGSQYNAFAIRKSLSLHLSTKETIRTIKVKQVITISAMLSSLFTDSSLPTAFNRTESDCRTFYAPTLSTYLSFLINNHTLNHLPPYAFKSHRCTFSK